MDDPFTQLYNRHPLVPTRHDIRLLYITPGDHDEPIHCTLQVKSLDESPEFEALSYVWGDEFDTVPIAVEDVTLDVTLNLYSALGALRPRPGNSRRPLWVDAVCINQRSIDEKNHQVPMMVRIYRECKDVIAWQGEAEPSVNLFLDLVMTLAREPRLVQQMSNYSVQEGLSRIWEDDHPEETWPEGSADDYDIFLSTFTSLITSKAKPLRFLQEIQAVDGLTAFKDFFVQTRLLEACLTAVDGCQKVLENVYWSRIWTFQEYELSAAVPLCRYGEVPIRWEELESSVAQNIQFYLSNLINRGGLRNPKLPSFVVTPEMKDLVNGLIKSKGVYDAVTELRAKADRMRVVEGVLANRRQAWSEAIYYFFWSTNDCDYSDPRDRVYALHGLLPALATAHPPDYNRDPSIVIVEALAFDVNRRSKMFYLGLSYMPLQLRRASDRPRQYPSWMPAVGPESKRPSVLRPPVTNFLPEWRGEVSELFKRRVKDERGRVIKPSIIPDQHILKAPVIRLRGTTKKLVTFAETLGQIQSQLVSLVDTLLRMQLFTSLPDLSARLVRCMSSYPMNRATKKYLALGIDRIISNRQNSETAPAADLGLFLHERVGNVLQRITVFIVDERMLGCGTDIRDGDTICIIPTVWYPFAICKERQDPGRGTIWNMVGAVYVDGLIENEGVDRVMVDELLSTPAEMLTFQ